MTTLKICMLAVMGVTAAAVIKQWKAELLPLLRVAVTLLLGGAALNALSPLIAYIGEMGEWGGLSEWTPVLWKALGIALLSHFCGEICRECGETGAAAGVELCGKAEILLLALPLIQKLLSLAGELLQGGGG